MNKILKISIVLTALFLIIYLLTPNNSLINKITGNDQIDTIGNLEDSILIKINPLRLPTDKQLYNAAIPILGKYAKVFIAIKIVESGHDYEVSGLARKYNNLLGMKVPKSRFTYAKSQTNGGYAVYDSWLDCLLDFKVLVQTLERKKIKRTGTGFDTEQDLLNSLARGFNNYKFWSERMVVLINKYGGNVVVPSIEFTPYNEGKDSSISTIEFDTIIKNLSLENIDTTLDEN